MNTEIPKILKNRSIEKTLTSNKELPQNIEAEQNVLGSILYDNESFDKISESFIEKHFNDPLHKIIF